MLFLYIIGYNNISWKPHDPHLEIWGSRPSHRPHRIDAYTLVQIHSAWEAEQEEEEERYVLSLIQMRSTVIATLCSATLITN